MMVSFVVELLGSTVGSLIFDGYGSVIVGIRHIPSIRVYGSKHDKQSDESLHVLQVWLHSRKIIEN